MSEAAAVIQPPEQLEEEAQGRTAKPIQESRLGLEIEKSNRWRVDVPMGTTPMDCMKEDYWQHTASKFRPGDEIVCMPDNMAWKLVLHVVGAGRLYAHVVQEELYELAPLESAITLPSIYEVKYTGTHHKWAVVRESKPLKDGFETEGLARRYAQNHESAVQR
jgi:hypothetical protein